MNRRPCGPTAQRVLGPVRWPRRRPTAPAQGQPEPDLAGGIVPEPQAGSCVLAGRHLHAGPEVSAHRCAAAAVALRPCRSPVRRSGLCRQAGDRLPRIGRQRAVLKPTSHMPPSHAHKCSSAAAQALATPSVRKAPASGHIEQLHHLLDRGSLLWVHCPAAGDGGCHILRALLRADELAADATLSAQVCGTGVNRAQGWGPDQLCRQVTL